MREPVQDQPTARTATGTVRGFVRGGVATFLGVPFAAPPFGERRFGAPARPQPWDGVREATAYGPTVPKLPYRPPYDLLLPEPQIPGEDCLNLNLWTPDPSGSGLPVFVWIHGGAFLNGSGAVPTYDGAAFARHGVVCVTINYRMGVDGFLQLPDAPANRGLLDQVAALQWVQENIAAFGGDPTRVTIGGQSAGGISVACHLAMPAAQGLFARAVLQSGAGHQALTLETAARIRGYLGERLNVADTREALAQVPLEQLIAAQQALFEEAGLMPDPARWGEVALLHFPFGPVVDGEVLPDLPIRRITAGSAGGVPVLAGANLDEFRLFAVPLGVVDMVTEDTLQMTAAGYGLPAEKALAAYRAAHPQETPGELMSEIVTDWYYWLPAVRLAEAKTAAGDDAWIYQFSWPSPQLDGRLGACHMLELPFVFDTLGHEAHQPLLGSAAPQELADQMHRAWVRFVTDGNPGWPHYDLQRRPVQDFGAESRLVDDPGRDLRQLWAGTR